MDKYLTSNHWGPGIVTVVDGRIVNVDSHPADPAGSAINGNISGSLNGRARVLRPAIRKGWLEGSAGTPRGERGRDAFVEVSWDEALDRLAAEINRVRHKHGNRSIFAGSYGWASAGRFHHAQCQLKRFLNTIGGFVRSEGNYSYQAALVLMPHIVMDYRAQVEQATRWPIIAEHSDLVVMFGGVAPRNMQVGDGGITRHRGYDNLRACAQASVRFVNLSPLRSDGMSDLNAEWLPPRPGTDTAVMMGLAHTLVAEDLHDGEFLDRYTIGFERFASYLNGEADGTAKDAVWAEQQSGISAGRIRDLAREMAAGRTMIAMAAGLQRADFGEQPLWMTVTLAAMLGQIGLPGGGYTVGYGVNGNIGNMQRLFGWGSLPQGKNPVDDFVPVAMTSEMLLNPGGGYSFDGEQRTFPDVRMVWWAGGNPFHHHQDLNRLRAAFQKPETIIVNEMNWTATARHADFVLPVAAPGERLDFGGGKSDNGLIPMPALVQPPGDARTEYETLGDLASRLGTSEAFTEGKSTEDWLRAIWDFTQQRGAEAGIELPDWDAFIAGDVVEVPDPAPAQVFLSDFRADPDGNPLPTPSGRIEIFSQTIADFRLEDCPGHATWLAPRDIAAGKADSHPFYLISGQPGTRLHSQLDNGAHSRSMKIKDREPVLIHPDDAAARGVADGDVVELFNDRGRCLAGARVTDDVARGCLFLWTGAWYDPDFDDADHRDRHGNPNVLTHDLRTSSLAQGPAAHSALVMMRRFDEPVPAVTVFDPPPFVARRDR